LSNIISTPSLAGKPGKEYKMDWTRRVDELKQQVNDYWDNMQIYN